MAMGAAPGRYDVDASGRIDGGDLFLVRSRPGHALP